MNEIQKHNFKLTEEAKATDIFYDILTPEEAIMQLQERQNIIIDAINQLIAREVIK